MPYFPTYQYRLVFLILFIHFQALLNAQFLELGVGGGACSYIGDINPGSFFTNTSVGGAVFVRYNWLPNLSTRLAGYRGKLQADDTRSPHYEIRSRNLDFESDLWELSLVQELNIMPYHPKKNKSYSFAPYLFAGISVFHFNPRTQYQGEWVFLQPLGTEGQGLPGYAERYKRWQAAPLLGGGIRLALTERVAVGLELGYRISFTDYLDDVSTLYVAPRDLQNNGPLAVALSNRSEEYTGIPADDLVGERRGNSNNKDHFMCWGVNFSFHFFSKKAFKQQKPEYYMYKWF